MLSVINVINKIFSIGIQLALILTNCYDAICMQHTLSRPINFIVQTKTFHKTTTNNVGLTGPSVRAHEICIFPAKYFFSIMSNIRGHYEHYGQ